MNSGTSTAPGAATRMRMCFTHEPLLHRALLQDVGRTSTERVHGVPCTYSTVQDGIAGKSADFWDT